MLPISPKGSNKDRRPASVVSKLMLPTKTLFISFPFCWASRCIRPGFRARALDRKPRIDLIAVFCAHARRRREIGKLDDHQRSDESLQAVKIEVNGSLPVIRFGDHSQAIAVVLDVLPFGNRLHVNLL